MEEHSVNLEDVEQNNKQEPVPIQVAQTYDRESPPSGQNYRPHIADSEEILRLVQVVFLPATSSCDIFSFKFRWLLLEQVP